MARYGRQFKERVVARLLPPESSPVEEVSNKVGIGVATLERWRAEILASASDDQPRRWTPAARLEAVIATAGLDETARSTWCREHGVFPTALDAWKRDAIAGLGEPADDSATAKQEKRRVKELERELRRKDKALAETAALLVLSKKLQAIFHQGEDA
jgi:transposase-like protein